MFPERTEWLKRPLGWEDLGPVKSTRQPGSDDWIYTLHSLCGRRVNIGKENGELFRFCKRCGVKGDIKE
jgi:hypothetical protein